MSSGSSTESQRPRPGSDLQVGCPEQEYTNGEAPGLGNKEEVGFSSPGTAVHISKREDAVITSIRATDLAHGLRRLPAGFYVSVVHSGFEWRTENKPVSVNNDDVEWSGPIPIPSELSTSVRLGVQASFEFQPMLGDGENLRELTITVGQLLDRSARHVPFTFYPKDGDVVSPCSSLLLTIGRRDRESNDLRVLEPHRSLMESRGQLADLTNNGHCALSRYRKHGEQQDLESAIEHFQHALDACPLGDPCYAAVLSNAAMAKLIYCRVYDTSASHDGLLTMCRNVLTARPVGHPDRPSTSIQLASVHLAQFEKYGRKDDALHVRAFLHEVIKHNSAASFESRAASLMLQSRGEHTSTALVDGRSSVQSLGSTDVDLRSLSSQLLSQYARFRDLADLHQAISCLEVCFNSTLVWDPWYPVGLTNLGAALFHRFNRLGELSDLEEAISTGQQAVRHTADDYPWKPKRLSDLSHFLVTRFKRLGKLGDLEEAISRQQSAVNLTSNDHPQKPCHLNNLGNSFGIRYEHFGELNDLEEAISRQQEAVNLTPDGHAHKPALLNNLCNLFKTRFKHVGQPDDLEEAISRQQDAVKLTPNDHPGKPCRLDNLGNSFFTRFKHFGELHDLEEAISSQQDAVNLTPDDHPHKPCHLNDLSTSLIARFKRLGETSDLEEAISMRQDVVSLTPDDHPEKPCRLSNLSNSFSTRFERLGELVDLERAISRQRDAVDLTPDDHPHKHEHLSNLGDRFRTRFKHLGGLSDLEEAISRQRDAVDLTPDDHPRRPGYLHNLGNSLEDRFSRLGELSDLVEAISRQQDAVSLTPDDHPEKPCRLNDLSRYLAARFERLGELNDLEEAILTQRDAVHLTPHNDPHKPNNLNNLSSHLAARFQRIGRLSDLEEAISGQQDAINLTPDHHREKPCRLNNLGEWLRARFRRLGELKDLEEAISRHRDSVHLIPDDHPHKPCHLNDLSLSLGTRFNRLGELCDLEEAILRQQDAVILTPDDHPHKPRHLNSLGHFFRVRFERLGELSDLEEGILRLRDAVTLTPDNHPDQPIYLVNLGICCVARFQRLGELSDLEEGILRQRDAVGLTPDDHPEKPDYLNSLSGSFKFRFQYFGELSDLEEAISRQRDAVNLTPYDHPAKPCLLNNLGGSIIARFVCLGEMSDLEEGISMRRDAVTNTPGDHPHRTNHQNDLSDSLAARFKHLGELSDLEEAISRQQDAVKFTPHNHADKPSRLTSLGNYFLTRFQHLGQQNDIERAAVLYSNAACADVGPITARFHASRHWIYCARRLRHTSLLSAYSVAIHLLPQVAWAGLSLAHRYRELIRGSDVVREGAAAALDSGHPEMAVEWLEYGRSIVWGELLQLRSSHDELSSVHPDHARRLRELSAALEEAGANREKLLSPKVERACSAVHDPTVSLRQEVDRHRMLAIERDKLLQNIRGLPGFERFLLHKEYSQLRASAHSGPVVILNAAKTRCDALIVLAEVDHVIHVPLPNFTPGRSKEFQSVLQSVVRHTRDASCDERYGYAVDKEGPGMWKPILAPLWKCVVKPVLDALSLQVSAPGDLPRIFWCPTGPLTFLPIHAAGFYDAQFSELGHKVFDFVVSSYVPTLSILASSPKPESAHRTGLRVLAVRQPLSDGQPTLPGVHAEMETIKTVIENSLSVRATLTESSLGTVDEVLDLMKQADWVHFACHGAQDDANPTNSGLCLADKRRLRISDIIALSRPHGGLAFLSACQTAKGDEDLSDEAIHIAAGMLFAGYGGVVGTMWSISDKLAPDIAKDVYEQLFRNGETTPDYREAARALHFAVGRLREREVPFKEWLPFIHLGL